MFVAMGGIKIQQVVVGGLTRPEATHIPRADDQTSRNETNSGRGIHPVTMFLGVPRRRATVDALTGTPIPPSTAARLKPAHSCTY